MRKLLGDNERFLSEKERQAELARLKREQLKAKQEGDFFTAALVLGLAERNREAAELRFVFRLIAVLRKASLGTTTIY